VPLGQLVCDEASRRSRQVIAAVGKDYRLAFFELALDVGRAFPRQNEAARSAPAPCVTHRSNDGVCRHNPGGADGGGEGFDIETTNPTAGIDVLRTLQTAALDASIGRTATQRSSPMERPQSDG
jgi:hypothetical protein